MRKINLMSLYAAAALLFVVSCAPSQDGSSASGADLVLLNATVWSGAGDGTQPGAVAIKGGMIAAVGSTEEIESHRGVRTRMINLQGAFLMPGFNDNHVHFSSAASFLDFNVMKVASQEEFENKVREVLGRIEPRDWITGGLWGAYDQWTADSSGEGRREPFSPNLRSLDQLTARNPMFLRKFDGSEYAVNAAALEQLGLSTSTPQLPGATFVRDANGDWTGIVRGDTVAEAFDGVIPPVSKGRRLQQTRNALQAIAEAGVTNVSDMSDDLQLQLYRQLHENDELTVRVHFRYPLERWPELAERGIEVGSGDPWIRTGGLKGHIDGIMGSSSARFYEPYDHDPSNRGRWRKLMVDADGEFAEGQFLQYMLDADAANLQLSIHAIGDEANGLLLDYLEVLRQRNGVRDRRFRLVHAQVIAQSDFERLGALDVIAEVQPFHLSDDMRWMEERIGSRIEGAYAFKSIRDSGARLSFGSDWPGTAAAEYPINPLLAIYAATTRQTLAGEPADGWFPEQRLSMEEALRAHTLGSAYANFEEDTKGTIEVGKLADLTVLDRDLLAIDPSDVLDARVLLTVVGGRVVYNNL